MPVAACAIPSPHGRRLDTDAGKPVEGLHAMRRPRACDPPPLCAAMVTALRSEPEVRILGGNSGDFPGTSDRNGDITECLQDLSQIRKRLRICGRKTDVDWAYGVKFAIDCEFEQETHTLRALPSAENRAWLGRAGAPVRIRAQRGRFACANPPPRAAK